MLVACRAGSTGPTEPSTNSSNTAVRGSVTEALTGSPIDGATLSFTLSGAARTLTTSGGGGWELAQGSIAGNALIEVSAPGYVTRRTHLLSVTTRGGISIDLIRDAAPFSLSTNWSHRDCCVTTFSVTEQHHARLAYARQPGNRDTDFDPLFSLSVQVPEAPPVIGCR